MEIIRSVTQSSIHLPAEYLTGKVRLEPVSDAQYSGK